MPEVYDATHDPRDLAPDALLRAIALYKACGWRRENMENFLLSTWSMTAPAVPEVPSPQNGIRAALRDLRHLQKGREVSIVQTNLEQAEMWLAKVPVES